MESPEYSTLMKQLTRFRLSGLASTSRAAARDIELEIKNIENIIEKNGLAPETCRQLSEEFEHPQKADELSRPLRGLYEKVRQPEDIVFTETEEKALPQAMAALNEGRGLLLRGASGERKCDTAAAFCRRYMAQHPEYEGMQLLVRKCSKRTSEMELCYERRRHIDNRIQLGYIAEGLLLANEQPQELVVLILDEIDTMDIVNALSVFWDILEKKGRDKMVGREHLKNSGNFLLIATENMENESRNVSMDNLGLRRIFQEVTVWDAEKEKTGGHKML